MKLIYIGDVMGEPGLTYVERLLPKLRIDLNIDIAIAQAENVTNGKGITVSDFNRLKKAGVDFCTGGNHILDNEDILPALNDPNQPIIRPANYPTGTPGLGAKTIHTSAGTILVISLLGQIVGRGPGATLDNPLLCIDELLERYSSTERVATIVNFHGDYSSEKVVIGHYLDGRVSAVIGDHWHVPTADARVLPAGTAHITDVGMVGILNSSLGVPTRLIIDRWRNAKKNRNEIETVGSKQFNALFVQIDQRTGLSTEVRQIQYQK